MGFDGVLNFVASETGLYVILVTWNATILESQEVRVYDPEIGYVYEYEYVEVPNYVTYTITYRITPPNLPSPSSNLQTTPTHLPATPMPTRPTLTPQVGSILPISSNDAWQDFMDGTGETKEGEIVILDAVGTVINTLHLMVK